MTTSCMSAPLFRLYSGMTAQTSRRGARRRCRRIRPPIGRCWGAGRTSTSIPLASPDTGMRLARMGAVRTDHERPPKAQALCGHRQRLRKGVAVGAPPRSRMPHPLRPGEGPEVPRSDAQALPLGPWPSAGPTPICVALCAMHRDPQRHAVVGSGRHTSLTPSAMPPVGPLRQAVALRMPFAPVSWPHACT